MKSSALLLISLLMMSLSAFGHGEHEAGPHGGTIRMPGAYHTELVIDGPKVFKVYLLDISFKSPITENSYVKAKFLGEKEHEASCKPESEYFLCEFKEAILENKGKLQIKSKRDKLEEGSATYRLPLEKH